MKGQRVTRDRMRKTVIFMLFLRMSVVNPYQPTRPAQIIRSSAPAGLPCRPSLSAQGGSRRGPSPSGPCSRKETAVACRRRSPDRWQDACKPASPSSRCQTRRARAPGFGKTRPRHRWWRGWNHNTKKRRLSNRLRTHAYVVIM